MARLVNCVALLLLHGAAAALALQTPVAPDPRASPKLAIGRRSLFAAALLGSRAACASAFDPDAAVPVAMSGATCKVRSCQVEKLDALEPLLDVAGVERAGTVRPEIEVRKFQGLKKDVSNTRVKAIMSVPFGMVASPDAVELMWFADADSGRVLACRGYNDDDRPSKESPAVVKFVEIFSNEDDLSAVRLVPRVYCTKSGLWQGEAFSLARAGKV